MRKDLNTNSLSSKVVIIYDKFKSFGVFLFVCFKFREGQKVYLQLGLIIHCLPLQIYLGPLLLCCVSGSEPPQNTSSAFFASGFKLGLAAGSSAGKKWEGRRSGLECVLSLASSLPATSVLGEAVLLCTATATAMRPLTQPRFSGFWKH